MPHFNIIDCHTSTCIRITKYKMAILLVLCFMISEAKSSNEYFIISTEIPAMSFTAPADQCLNADVLTALSGGNPSGGIYSGPGVSDDGNGSTYSFNPALAGIGTHTLTYTVGGDDFSDDVIVNPIPNTFIMGLSEICIGATSEIVSSTPGTWFANDPLVATVDNNGIITAVGAGFATFVFTDSATGCSSNTSDELVVNGNPMISMSSNVTCIGGTISMTPSSGGTWSSSNNSVATITNTGIVTAVSSGNATFTFTDSFTGCSSDPSGVLTISEGTTPLITGGDDQLCIGETTQLSPSSGGVWSSSNNSVSTITNTGIVTAIDAGSATFIFTDNATGCSSEPSDPVIVNEMPAVSIVGDDQLCQNETTQLSPSSGGTWMSSNSTVASANSSGFVNTSQSGMATFIFMNSATGCSSEPSDPVTVNEIPLTSITGDTEICIGETSQMSPSSGGTWISNNQDVATITNSGLVTGVDSGLGTFIYTNSTTGCSSEFSSDIIIKNLPLVTIIGAEQICIGASTQLSPSSGGDWISNDISIATIDNNGIVTAVSSGPVTFVFTETETGCSSNPSDPVTVLEGPAISMLGDDAICIGETTQMSPSEDGSWESSDNSVAMITSFGVVTAFDAGTVTFVFTAFDTGCNSEPSDPVTVNETPVASIIGTNQICIGENTQLSPSSGGTWTSNNEAVATVSNNGVVTGIDPGSATFIFTNTTTGCSSEPSPQMMVNNAPSISIVGEEQICIGETTEMSPSGGTWTSSDNSVATINIQGLVTAIAPGAVTFIFTDPATGCDSDPSDPVVVSVVPSVSITGDDEICIGETTQISPSTGGAWTSSNNGVATITNSGVITGVTPGTATFTYTDLATGCNSDPSDPVLINDKPTTSLAGPDEICIGEVTQLFPSTGGVWLSNDPGIASINSTGTVTGLDSGVASFVFTDSSTGCSSDASSLITVNPQPTISISGATEIFIGETTTLMPSTGGTWISLDESVATIDNSGLVTGISVGSTNFIFTSNDTNCSSNISDPVMVNEPPFIFVGNDENWNTPSNWNYGVVPQVPIVGDVILMENVTYSSGTMMTIAASGSITINSGVVFTINTDLKIEEGGLIQNNGGTIQIND